MRIGKIDAEYKNRKSFGSIRVDKQNVRQLKEGETPLIDNTKLQIYAALSSLSQNPTRNNIMFLLDVADNLAYGQGKNSEFKDELDESGLTPENRENTDWSRLLEDTIRKSISESTEDVSDLEDEFTRIFSEKKELTPLQSEILEGRRQLLSAINREADCDDEETIAKMADLRKNIDYFTASSEISAKQKKECFDKLLYFLGDEYEIVPELEDKKIQVLDEMFEDMIVKTPQNDVLTTKGIDQRQSGICAAISICRKALAYEDKTRFVDIIIEELRNSETMPIYDITELGSGKKVEVTKASVDYNDAINKGYRIIDASAHIWMQNAHASGDGTIQTEFYIPFDNDDYDIYNDSSWFTNNGGTISPEKLFLMTLIKEKDLLKSFKKAQKSLADTRNGIARVKKEVFNSQKASMQHLELIFSQILPNKSEKEISNIISSLLKFYTETKNDNEVNISSQMSDELKQKVLTDYLINSIDGITDEEVAKIKEKAPEINHMADEYSQSALKLDKLKGLYSKRSKYIYNKRLYKIAAAHRLAVESNLQLGDSICQYEKMTGLPPRDIQIKNYMKSLFHYFEVRNASSEVIAGNIYEEYSPEEMKKELLKDTMELDKKIPKQLDSIAETFFGKTVNEMVLGLMYEIRDEISAGNKEYFEQLQRSICMNGDKKEVLRYINRLIEKLSNTPDEETTLTAIRDLGYNDRFQFLDVTLNSFVNSFNQDLDDEHYQILLERFGCNQIDELPAVIGKKYQQYENIKQHHNDIVQKWSVPPVQANILEKLEKQHFVLSRRKLDILKNRFAEIDAAVLKNEKIQNVKERKKANNSVYNFTNEENEILALIEDHIPLMKKYCKVEYQEMNKYLSDELEELYSGVGMLNGQFWVREEGSSGLTSNEQVRIFEQMTGKPYHVEKDIKEAAKQIREGKGSGILSISVDDSDYAFHAQYAPVVSEERFRNPITGVEKIKDIIWTDNSWGKTEKEHFWNGHDGFEYTDYNGGYGWKNGFILAKDFRIGLPVQDVFGAIGTAKEDNDRFSLFMDMVLPGAPVNAYQKLYKMFNYIFTITNGEKSFEALEKSLSDGYKLNADLIEKVDEIAELKLSRIRDRIKEGFNSEEDFTKLSEEDELKFLFNKLAVYVSSDDPVSSEMVLDASSVEELQEVKQNIRERHIELMKSIIGKSEETLEKIDGYTEDDLQHLFDEMEKQYGVAFSDEEIKKITGNIFYEEGIFEQLTGQTDKIEEVLKAQIEKVAASNIQDEKARLFFINQAQDIVSKSIEKLFKITSLDDALITNSPLADYFVAAIDKYYEPSSDEEMISIIQSLQNVDNETADKFFEKLSDEELGIKLKSPFDYLQLYRAYDSDLEKAVSEIVTYETVNKYMNTNPSDEDSSSPEEIYRSLYITLSDLDVQKFIKSYKAEAFQKYQVRQAFPQPVPISDNILSSAIIDMIDLLMGMVDDMENTKTMLNMMSEYNRMIDKYSSKKFFKDMLAMKNHIISESEKEDFEGFINSIKKLYVYSKEYITLDMISEPLNSLIHILPEDKEEDVNVVDIGQYIRLVMSVFEDFESSGITEDSYLQNKKDKYNEIQKNIRMLVNANIDPRYANDGIRKLNRLLKLYKENCDEDTLKKVEDELVNLLVDKHITKNPTALLKKIVEMIQEGKKDKDEYAVLRSYLISTLQVAEQTKIQYKLVQNQHTGISSKTKDLLSIFKVYLKDNTTDSLDSEQGILYLVEQLKNDKDNNATLKLFLNQSGLSKAAVKALINNFDLDNYKNIFEEDVDNIICEISKLNNMVETADRFFKHSEIKYKSIKDAVEHLIAYMKRHLPEDSEDEIPMYAKYYENIRQLSSSSASNAVNPQIISSIVEEYSRGLMKEIAELINSEIDSVSNFSNQVGKRVSLINSIIVPVDSEEYKQRQQFLEKYKEFSEFISNKNQEISELVRNYSLIEPC